MNEIVEQIVDIFSKDKSYFENRECCAFYNKYNEECLCFRDSWNFQVSNLVDKDLTDNRAVNCEKLKPFYEWFGERIELALNLVKGKSNEQLKDELHHPTESEGENA